VTSVELTCTGFRITSLLHDSCSCLYRTVE